jgi:2-keto-3-deoxy-L-rhamnonate aldolase RhmA
MAQIEDAAALEVLDAIAAVPGIDSLFVGPADFAVALGADSVTDPKVLGAYDRVAAAARRAGRNLSTFAATNEIAKDLKKRGVSAFLVGADLTFVLNGGRDVVTSLRGA